MGIFAGAIDYFQRGGACMWPLLIWYVSMPRSNAL